MEDGGCLRARVGPPDNEVGVLAGLNGAFSPPDAGELGGLRTARAHARVRGARREAGEGGMRESRAGGRTSSESQRERLVNDAPCSRPSVHVAGSVNCNPEMPVKASKKEPARSSSVAGVWSEASMLTVPSRRADHSFRLLDASRRGGATLSRVSPLTTDSASNIM